MKFSFFGYNAKLIKDFARALARQAKITAASSVYGTWVSKYSCYDSFLNLPTRIYFYEWSNLETTPKIFLKVGDFYEFLEQSKIAYPTYNEKDLFRNCSTLYITCKKDKPELIIKTSLSELKKEFVPIN